MTITDKKATRLGLFMLPVLPFVLIGFIAMWIYLAVDLGIYVCRLIVLDEEKVRE